MTPYPTTTGTLDLAALFRQSAAATFSQTAFANLLPEEATIFGTFCDIVTLAAGDRLFEAGSPDDSLYIVVGGRLTVAGPGRGCSLTTIDAGEVLGEVSFLDGGRRTVTVVAMEPGRLLRCLRWRWEDLQVLYPGIAAKIAWDLARSLAARSRPTEAGCVAGAA